MTLNYPSTIPHLCSESDHTYFFIKPHTLNELEKRIKLENYEKGSRWNGRDKIVHNQQNWSRQNDPCVCYQEFITLLLCTLGVKTLCLTSIKHCTSSILSAEMDPRESHKMMIPRIPVSKYYTRILPDHKLQWSTSHPPS